MVKMSDLDATKNVKTKWTPDKSKKTKEDNKPKDTTIYTVEFSACEASKGCDRKSKCHRYAQATKKIDYHGFMNHHLCLTDEYLYFKPMDIKCSSTKPKTRKSPPKKTG